MSEQAESGGAREPADVDRPPVSRVGDELQQRAPEPDVDVTNSEAEAAERDAFEAAQQKGWDKSVKDAD